MGSVRDANATPLTSSLPIRCNFATHFRLFTQTTWAAAVSSKHPKWLRQGCTCAPLCFEPHSRSQRRGCTPWSPDVDRCRRACMHSTRAILMVRRHPAQVRKQTALHTSCGSLSVSEHEEFHKTPCRRMSGFLPCIVHLTKSMSNPTCKSFCLVACGPINELERMQTNFKLPHHYSPRWMCPKIDRGSRYAGRRHAPWPQDSPTEDPHSDDEQFEMRSTAEVQILPLDSLKDLMFDR